MTYVILGYGRSGKSCEEFLQKKGEKTLVWDDALNLTPSIMWDQVHCVIQSPGIAPTGPKSHWIHQKAKSLGLPIKTDIDLLVEAYPYTPIIGITGTNGKSTITALVTHLLKNLNIPCVQGGNIGVPVLDLVDPGATGFFVLELSSYQLTLSQPLPLVVGAIVNITPDHLDWHETLASYIDGKKRIFERARHKILGLDTPLSRGLMKDGLMGNDVIGVKVADLQTNDYQANATEIAYSVRGMTVYRQNDPILVVPDNIALRGDHNKCNIVVACSIVWEALRDRNKENGVMMVHEDEILPSTVLAKGLETFTGLAHRLERVTTIDNVLFVNDSKATNLDSMYWALKTYQDFDLYLIVGGRAKSRDFGVLDSIVHHIKAAFVIGESVDWWAQYLQHRGILYFVDFTLDYAVAHSFAMAREASQEKMQNNQPVVMLSPGCSSLDQFNNFEHRGDVFKSLCQQIITT